MNFYPEEQIVEIVIPFTDADGAAVSVTEITAILYDGEDAVVMDFGAISFDPVGVEARIVIPKLANRLLGDDLEEVRRLVVQVTHTTGSFWRSHSYGIESEQRLQIMKNSFMTYETALMNARKLVNLTAFTGTTEERQVAALIEAWRRIIDLPMIYAWVDADGNVETEHRISAETWHYIDADAFQTNFPTHFKRALRDAQLAEADEILQGNIVARKHAQGIASETIGESSVTLREGFAGSSSSGLGSSALTYLSGYIDNVVVIGRA